MMLLLLFATMMMIFHGHEMVDDRRLAAMDVLSLYLSLRESLSFFFLLRSQRKIEEAGISFYRICSLQIENPFYQKIIFWKYGEERVQD